MFKTQNIMKYESIIRSLVDEKAKQDNQIDLHAYENGMRALANHLVLDEIKTKGGQFLSFDESDEEILVMVKSIQDQSKIDGSILIDYVDNVQTAEAFEFRFTCDEFLEMIS